MRAKLPFFWLVLEETLPLALLHIVWNDSIDWLLFYHSCRCGSHARHSALNRNLTTLSLRYRESGRRKRSTALGTVSVLEWEVKPLLTTSTSVPHIAPMLMMSYTCVLCKPAMQ